MTPSKVKENIKNNLDNSKIINENSQKFPVYATIDGYDVKVEQNGKVKDASSFEKLKEENVETINNQVNDNSIKIMNNEIGYNNDKIVDNLVNYEAIQENGENEKPAEKANTIVI